MTEFYREPRLRALATLMAVGSLGLTACSDPPENKIISCQGQNVGDWTAVPGAINTQKIAETLGVTEQQVREGRFGNALCERDITADELATSDGVRVEVKDVGKLCLAVGFQGNPADESQRDIVAVCANPAAPSASTPVATA